jgi:hypothetical protein
MMAMAEQMVRAREPARASRCPDAFGETKVAVGDERAHAPGDSASANAPTQVPAHTSPRSCFGSCSALTLRNAERTRLTPIS